jgi:hypothetical protein
MEHFKKTLRGIPTRSHYPEFGAKVFKSSWIGASARDEASFELPGMPLSIGGV